MQELTFAPFPEDCDICSPLPDYYSEDDYEGYPDLTDRQRAILKPPSAHLWSPKGEGGRVHGFRPKRQQTPASAKL